MRGVIIALHEERVSVAVGNIGKTPKINEICSEVVKEPGMAGWREVLRGMWETYNLPKKNVTLVLPDTAVTVKVVTAPDMPEKKIADLVRHEMQSHEDREIVADYQFLSKKEDGCVELFAAAIERKEMQTYLEMCLELGLSVTNVAVAIAGYIKMIDIIDEMHEKTCIWLLFEENSMQSILIENGRYRYASRSRIFSEMGTVDFSTEVTRNISGILQFHASNHSAYKVTDIYYAHCSDDDFEVCLGSIGALGLNVSRIPNSTSVDTLPDGQNQSDWLDCIGAMLR